MKSYVVKSVGIWSVAKLSLFVYGVLGLFAAITLLMVSVVMTVFFDVGEGFLPVFMGGFINLILLPLFSGGAGALVNAGAAFLYNIFSALIGGMKFSLDEKRP